jgi:hypothetical protein
MDLMQLHPKATDDGGDLLRQMEPKDSGEQQGYYSTTGRSCLNAIAVLCYMT